MSTSGQADYLSQQKGDYRTSITEITVHHVLDFQGATGLRVQLEKTQSGDLIILLVKDDMTIRLHPEELLLASTAAGKLLRQQQQDVV